MISRLLHNMLLGLSMTPKSYPLWHGHCWAPDLSELVIGVNQCQARDVYGMCDLNYVQDPALHLGKHQVMQVAAKMESSAYAGY